MGYVLLFFVVFLTSKHAVLIVRKPRESICVADEKPWKPMKLLVELLKVIVSLPRLPIFEPMLKTVLSAKPKSIPKTRLVVNQIVPLMIGDVCGIVEFLQVPDSFAGPTTGI